VGNHERRNTSRPGGGASAAAALRPGLIAILIALALLAAQPVAGKGEGPGPAPAGTVAPRPAATVAAPSSSPTAIVIAALDLAVVTALVALGVDVRLLLVLGSVPLFAAVGRMPDLLAKLAAEMVNPGTVVPIGAAMGFAFVLRVTQCDQHLVQLLVRPLRRVRVLLIPGGIAAGYLINMTIVSQAGTASVLGPILIPLLRAGGLAPARAGAVLLLGASMGGELFNPGAVEMRKLAELTHLRGPEVVARSRGLNLLACSTALAVFWLLAARGDRARRGGARELAPAAGESEPGGEAPFRVNPVKALVPLLPLLILSSDSVLGTNPLLGALEGPPRILAAMLIGVAAAGLTSPRSAGALAPAFFEGAGYAYHHVISLIVAASTFAEGVRLSGLIELVIRSIAPWPHLALVVGMVAPWCLAVVSGTGIAPAVAVMEFFVPAAHAMGLEPTRLGTVSALGAHFGRTMSPAAAVVMVSARLAQARGSELIRHVALPLVVGGAALLAAALLGVL
jgi:DcuC family C4-dicarboxylate transporter